MSCPGSILAEMVVDEIHVSQNMKKRLMKTCTKAGDAGIEYLIHCYTSRR